MRNFISNIREYLRRDGLNKRTKEFIASESTSGKLIIVFLVIALIIANSPLSDAFADFTHLKLGLTVHDWVNDILMAVFFYIIGVEIRHEITDGEFRDRKQAVWPIAAAIGGMAIPAAIFAVINIGTDSLNGWAIPTATDIALVVGLLGLLGKRIPNSLRVFLLTLAIADDLLAIIVIGIFYGGGLHPAIIGAFLGLILPSVDYITKRATALSTLIVIPLFVLVNANVQLSGLDISSDFKLFIGIILGLVLGKTIGIFGTSWLLAKTKVIKIPEAISNYQLLGASVLAGIGFTVSMFVATLAFSDPDMIAVSKIGIFIGSLLAGILGMAILQKSSKR